MRRGKCGKWGLLLFGMAGAVLSLHIVAATAFAQWNEDQKITAGDGAGNDRFGAGVTLQGTTAVVGAHFKNSNTGAAYVFTDDGTTWSQSQKLTASDGEANDYFGAKVALNGGYLVAGATGDDDAGAGAGAIYVFEQSAGTWSQSAKLTTTNISVGMGSSLDMQGTTVAAGATGNNTVHIFNYGGSSWSNTQTIAGPTGSAYFGYSLDLSASATRLIVGDRRYTGSLLRQGAAHVYDYVGSTWSYSTTLLASDAIVGAELGRSISIDGDLVAVGAGVVNAVYLFEDDGAGNWSEVAKITADDSIAGDYFGDQVSLNGNMLVVGAYGGTGAVYTFKYDGTTWAQLDKITASDAALADNFGASLDWDVATDRMIVGAMLDDDLGSSSGSAYIFSWTDPIVPYPGDANKDGTVDEVDAQRLADNWLATGADWSMGDFNNDQVVDDKDATLMAANWGKTKTAATAVPEPSMLVLLCGAFVLLAVRRRRIG